MTEMRKAYGDAAEKLLHFVESKTTDQTGSTMQVAVESYLDPDQWQREIDLIFKRLPLMLALTVEMPAKGDYKAISPMGMPVLLTRGSDGRARAFLNVCRHRAMKLVDEGENGGRGNCRAFSCPYHGWTYANDGRLLGITEASTFGDVDKSTLGLTELPCEEVAGMIFAILTPGLPIDIPAFLGGMLDDLAALRLETWYFHKSKPMQGANWKVAYDGYLEGYHFQAAHPETVLPRTPSNRAYYEAFGPHIRLSYPQHRIVELKDLPREEWGERENLNYDFIRMLFPNFAMFLAPEMCQVAQLFPGDAPGRNVTIMNYIFPTAPASEAEREELDRMSDFFFDVVEKEDYLMGMRVQQGLEAQRSGHVTFGRNELGNQYFHKWIAHYLSQGTVPEPLLRAD
ncbi:SRPBCC family protein [Novosphingobium sp. PY1]|uniref:aromatic ring-hydroxylating oxygenase subunit alpha n=1 Tax=Novosphingobium sp. PY1 TaxID=1882221 RepID=UPI000BE78B0C|nr:SRPBCC family protein [Novosphingobium sp. PY1]BBA72012.1 putative Rieske oxygenase [Novosphingobium sp. PY1]GFM28230.1 Rieske (2Fe-2S) domain-containing protein [Novosphingobium sp. PY1]